MEALYIAMQNFSIIGLTKNAPYTVVVVIFNIIKFWKTDIKPWPRKKPVPASFKVPFQFLKVS